MNQLSESEMRQLLAKEVAMAGGQKALARDIGVSPQYVCDCLNGRRTIGEGIARPLGYEPVTVYVKINEARPEALERACELASKRETKPCAN